MTPAFLGGADSSSAELRAPSLKGAIRFWWRALNWAGARADCDTDEQALRRLHQREASLFGVAAAREGASGQSKFLLEVVGSLVSVTPEHFRRVEPGHAYLMGQGLYARVRVNDRMVGRPTRASLDPGVFDARLVWRPGTTEEDARSVLDALTLFGLLGGLGSGSRSGLGSVAVHSVKGDYADLLKPPTSESEYGQFLDRLAQRYRWDTVTTLAPFTAFTADYHQARKSAKPGSKAWDVLREAGRFQQIYLVGDARNHVAGRFADDTAAIAGALDGRKFTKAPRRVVFGLPRNSFFVNTQLTVEVGPDHDLIDRRSSPLFTHVHEFPSGAVMLVQSVIPARFLPEGVGIAVNAERRAPFSVPADVDFGLVRKFADDCVAQL